MRSKNLLLLPRDFSEIAKNFPTTENLPETGLFLSENRAILVFVAHLAPTTGQFGANPFTKLCFIIEVTYLLKFWEDYTLRRTLTAENRWRVNLFFKCTCFSSQYHSPARPESPMTYMESYFQGAVLIHTAWHGARHGAFVKKGFLPHYIFTLGKAGVFQVSYHRSIPYYVRSFLGPLQMCPSCCCSNLFFECFSDKEWLQKCIFQLEVVPVLFEDLMFWVFAARDQ